MFLNNGLTYWKLICCYKNIFYDFFSQIKIVNIPEKYCRTLLGTGAPGDSTGSSPALIQLNEPGGLCIDNKRQLLYISDTNNHCIKVFDWQSKITTKVM